MPYTIGGLNPSTKWVGTFTLIDSKGAVATSTIESPSEITMAELDTFGTALGQVTKCDIRKVTRSEVKEVMSSSLFVTDQDASVLNKGTFVFGNNNLNRTRFTVPGLGRLYVTKSSNINLEHADIIALTDAWKAIKNDGLSGAAVWEPISGIFNGVTRKVRTDAQAPAETSDNADDSGDPNATTP
jgi:hypothetical protein